MEKAEPQIWEAGAMKGHGTNGAVAEAEMVLQVVDRREAAVDVVELTLGRSDSTPLPPWAPGAHIDLLLDNGVVRQYSLAGSPDDRCRWRLGVLRERGGRGGSEFIHTQLAAGYEVAVRGPRNNFPLVTSPRYLFIAGGIGITPLLPMIAAVDAAGAEWNVLYGGRTRPSMAFCEELQRYGERAVFRPQDQFGLLDLKSVLGEPRTDTAIYCCGPEPLIAAVEDLSQHWPENALHVERFAPRPEHAAAPPGSSFEIELARSGLVLQVPPDKSILNVITEAGIPVLTSCEDGICGTCLTAVLDGLPDHRDCVLSAGERKSGRAILPCVSRALTPRLVLDL